MMVPDKMKRQLKQGWLGLSPRDRLALGVLAAFVGVLLIIYGAIQPAHQYAEEASTYYKEKQRLLGWMKANAGRVKALPQAQLDTESDVNQSLLTLASATARNHQIKFKRFEPNGDSELRIWLEKMPFNQLMRWLDLLKSQHNVSVEQLNLDRRELPGTVNARLVLRR